MDPRSSDVVVIKSEPEIIIVREQRTEPGEQSPTSPCDAILQYGIFKQETEDASDVMYEPGTLAAEEHLQESGSYSKIDIEYLANTESESSLTAMNTMTSDVGVIKSEPEIISEEESPTFPCDAILQYGIVKQETVDASEIKCEPGTLAAEEHVQECGAYSEIDIDYPDIKKEYFVHLEKIDQSQGLKTYPVEKRLFFPHCNYSGTCKSNKPNFERHLRTHTGKKSFSCADCNYSCSQNGDLKMHTLTHSEEKPFSCPDCSKSFSNNSVLTRHMLIHSGKKPFSCSYCTYSCFQRGDLKKHNLIHTGEKPFSCSECNCKFSQKGHLKNHVLTHSGEKPFSCSECSYSSSRKCNLASHMLTHSGEKPFSCSKCNYSCHQKYHLTRHMLTHSREKSFSCT